MAVARDRRHLIQVILVCAARLDPSAVRVYTGKDTEMQDIRTTSGIDIG